MCKENRCAYAAPCAAATCKWDTGAASLESAADDPAAMLPTCTGFHGQTAEGICVLGRASAIWASSSCQTSSNQCLYLSSASWMPMRFPCTSAISCCRMSISTCCRATQSMSIKSFRSLRHPKTPLWDAEHLAPGTQNPAGFAASLPASTAVMRP